MVAPLAFASVVIVVVLICATILIKDGKILPNKKGWVSPSVRQANDRAAIARAETVTELHHLRQDVIRHHRERVEGMGAKDVQDLERTLEGGHPNDIENDQAKALAELERRINSADRYGKTKSRYEDIDM